MLLNGCPALGYAWEYLLGGTSVGKLPSLHNAALRLRVVTPHHLSNSTQDTLQASLARTASPGPQPALLKAGSVLEGGRREKYSYCCAGCGAVAMHAFTPSRQRQTGCPVAHLSPLELPWELDLCE